MILHLFCPLGTLYCYGPKPDIVSAILTSYSSHHHVYIEGVARAH